MNADELPGWWRELTYCHGVTNDVITIECDADAEVAVTMVTVDGGHYGAKHKHTRNIPVEVWLWVARRLEAHDAE